MTESLTIRGLTTVDRYELEDMLSQEDVTFDEHEVRPGDMGELGTIIVTVLVTKAALAALAVWASQKSKARDVAGQTRIVYRQKVMTTGKGGTKETLIEFEAESKEALQEGLATQLAGIFQLDVAAVLNVLNKIRGKS